MLVKNKRDDSFQREWEDGEGRGMNEEMREERRVMFDRWVVTGREA